MSRMAVLLVLGLVWPSRLLAQGAQTDAPASRAAVLDAARAAREQALHPEQRGRLERLLTYVEDHRVIERLNPPQGLHPVVGSVTRGGGFGIGAGYRRRPMAGRLLIDTSAALTPRGYRTAQLSVGALSMGGQPVDVTAGTRWYDFPQEDFFGLGPDTSDADRVAFALRGLDTYAQVAARKAGWLVMRGRIGVHRYEAAPGEDRRFPSVEERFTERTAPGLAQAATLRYAEASAGLDTRDQAGNPRSGGLYNVAFALFDDGRGDRVAFNRIDVTAMHVIPIFDKKRGIALRGVVSHIDPVGASRVPFFLMPTVGGTDSLRGFRDFRFRDAAAITLNAEYRWEAFSGLDLALFLDAADVGPTWESLVGADLKSSWGLGFRFNTNKRVLLRLDVAGGREGPRVWAAFGPVFRR